MYEADRTINFKNGKVVSIERPSFIKEYDLTVKNGKIINKVRVDEGNNASGSFISRLVRKITFQHAVGAATVAIGLSTVALSVGEGAFIAMLGAAYMFVKIPEKN